MLLEGRRVAPESLKIMEISLICMVLEGGGERHNH
jgi:hypothetical protein